MGGWGFGFWILDFGFWTPPFSFFYFRFSFFRYVGADPCVHPGGELEWLGGGGIGADPCVCPVMMDQVVKNWRALILGIKK